MEMQFRKVYPYNFIVLALEVVDQHIGDEELARIDAYAVDVYVKSHSYFFRDLVERALSEEALSETERRDFRKICASFRQRLQQGSFRLVSLKDYDRLALSWVDVRNLVYELEHSSGDEPTNRLEYMRAKLEMFLLQARNYTAERSDGIEENTRERLISSLPIESRTKQVLIENHIQTVADLISVSAECLLNLRGFGEARLKAVRECLERLDLHLLGE